VSGGRDFVGYGKCVAENLLVGLADDGGLEDLRGFHGPEVSAVDWSGGDAFWGGALEGIGDAVCRGGGSGGAGGGEAAGDLGWLDEGPGPVVNGDERGGVRQGREAIPDREVALGASENGAPEFRD